MGLFSTTKGIVNHWNCHGTRRNPAWATPSDGEKHMDLVSLNLLQDRKEVFPGFPHWKAPEHSPGSTKAAVGASVQEHPQPSPALWIQTWPKEPTAKLS